MKNYLFFALLLCWTGLSAQKYGNIWQFGNGAGIDFNTCPPVALTNGVNSGFEGCSSVCDETTGQLLFYTNSLKVWNSQNVVMQNGNLIGASTSTMPSTLSQVLIIKKPLSSSIYYIFTTMIQGVGPLSFRYHTIDMSLNGGLGSVVSANNVITTTTITEQVAATFHNNGTDVWVMTHEYGTNNFLAYLVTSAGVTSTAVVSSVGPTQITGNSNFNARGEIKFSPNGLKLAFNGNGNGLNNATNILCLFDFNNSTGAVSNPLNLPYARGEYGLSFSPDNSKLYGTTWKAFNFPSTDYNYLYQFDLSSGNPTNIINSRVMIDSILGPNVNYFGSIKLAPDGKIYAARYNAGFLSVINSPNLPGTSCNYVVNGFNLVGKICQYGLNNYIEYTNYTTYPSVSVSVVSTSSLLCAGQTAVLTASGATSYSWNPGMLSGSNILITPTAPVTFSVIGTDTLSGCMGTATITQNVSPLPIITAISSAPVICPGASVTLTGSGGANSFLWTPGNLTGSSVVITPSSTTTYTLSGTDTLTGCSNASTIIQNVSSCTGISEFQSSNNSIVKIFPNPGSGEFIISSDGDLNLNIISETGQIVKTIALTEKNNYLALLSDLANGIYYIFGNTKDQFFKEKIIVIK